nr:DUF4157 domain-containing protein [Streptomyces sp. alain-838]
MDTAPENQRGLLEAAKATPSSPLPGAFLSQAKSFYRNDRLSEGRVHDNPTAQRATAALGAQAMTVGKDIFLGPSAVGNTRILAHEASHLDKNLRGVRETGNDNGAGVTVTDPGQDSERAAETDGAPSRRARAPHRPWWHSGPSRLTGASGTAPCSAVRGRRRPWCSGLWTPR